ncbi:M4 family metallopeptidase [Desulfonatronum parangueonense]
MKRRCLRHWLGSVFLLWVLVIFSTLATAAVLDDIHVHPLPAGISTALSAAAADGHASAANPRDTVMALRAALSGYLGDTFNGIAGLPEGKPVRTTRADTSSREIPDEIILKAGAQTPRQIVMPVRDVVRTKAGGWSPNDQDYHLEMAGDFLYVYRDVLRLADPDREKALVRYFQDGTGRAHVRYAQQYKDIPVWPAQWQISLTPDGRVERFSGAYAPTPKRLVLKPTVDSFRAIEIAFAVIAHAGLVVEDPSAVGIDEELIIFAPGDRPAILTWKVELHVSLDQVWRVLVDAHAGFVLDAYNTIPGVSSVVSGTGVLGDPIAVMGLKEGDAYVLLDTSKPMFDQTAESGVIMTLDARNTVSETLWHHTAPLPSGPWVADGLSLHRNMSLTYDYFHQVHDWSSFDGQGHDLVGITRIGQNYYNAFWNPHHKIMGYGDARPFVADLGVVAHEFTHGITSSTSDLVYRDQSGSANEAMSDIFGVAADAWAKGRINWIMGYIAEDGGMRSLSDPGSIRIAPDLPYVYPSRMSEYLGRDHPLWEMIGTDDHGGVHINNMIVSHAFYLMAEALPGAMGLERAAAIFFRANTVHLLSNSQFIDVRLACIASAEELYGKGSPEALIVAQAFDMVEIYDPAFSGEPVSPRDPRDIPFLSGADNDIFLFATHEGTFLGRREAALGDPVQGVQLSSYPAAAIRPSVSRDGTFVSYVTIDDDMAVQVTDGSEDVEKLGMPGFVYSTSMSPDGNKYAFVLQDEEQPSNTIVVVDARTGEVVEYQLRVQLFDAPPKDMIRFAETMTFSADGNHLVYDAFSVFDVVGGDRIGAWAVYALDLTTGMNYPLVSSASGLHIGNPSLANTTNDVMTMDVYDPVSNTSTVITLNLLNGNMVPVHQIPGMVGVPAFTGDDQGIVFSYPNQEKMTGSSLSVQALAADRMTPQGEALWYLDEGFAGVVYRRAGNDPVGFTIEQWVTSFYLAYWNRLPDAAGHAYWTAEVYRGALEVPGVAENFALSDESRAIYAYFNAPESASTSQVHEFLRSVYRNLFGRDTTEDDPGIAYWTSELQSGRTTPGAVIGNIIYAAMTAQGEDWRAIRDKVHRAEQDM